MGRYVAWSGGVAAAFLFVWYGIQDALPQTPPDQTRVIVAEKEVIGQVIRAGEYVTYYWVGTSTSFIVVDN